MDKGLKALQEIKDFAKNEWEDERFDFSTIEKELKALEIIKPYLNKIVGMNVCDKDFYECFLQIGNKRVFITKEEYDLLKEALL